MTVERYLQETGSASTRTSPFPLVEYVPAMLAEDPFLERFLDGLDHILGPLIVQVDCLAEYLDPRLTTREMLEFLGYWINAQVLADMTDDEVRTSVLTARELNSLRGTSAGIEAWLKALAIDDVEIDDSGSVVISGDISDPSTWPAAPPAKVTVTLGSSAMGSEEFELLEDGLHHLVPAGVLIEVKGGPAKKKPARKNATREQ